MKVIQVENNWGMDNLAIVEKDQPTPGAGEVLLHIKAASLNYRDLLTVQGLGGADPLPRVPFSDGSAEIVAVGEGVSRVKVGDRVCPLFFPQWMDGEAGIADVMMALGGTQDGVLQEYMVLGENSVTPVPAHLSDAEAACLPCAGLTAWRAVFEEGKIKAGDTVLVEGTGGVSIFALQFAKSVGASVVVASSSDEKLNRAKEMGADHLINYNTTPDWGNKVMELTGGKGADVVVEVGGQQTMTHAMNAVAYGGRIVIIGVLSGYTMELLVPAVFAKQLKLIGISVGSRAMFERMTAHMEQHKIKPVIDARYGWGEVKDALNAMQTGGHFGKIVIEG